jgi:nucleotide-binding universal stress UspA family protein
MYRVLVPVDGDEKRAVAEAQAVAELPGVVEAYLLNVFEEFQAFDDAVGTIDSGGLYDPNEFPESVETAHERLDERGVDVEVLSAHGDPAEEILRAAQEHAVDAIAMAGRKRTPVGKVIFGSVTQAVILDADCPVIVVPTGE